MNGQIVFNAVLVGQNGGDAPVGDFVALMLQGNGQVIFHQLTKLQIHDIPDGIPQAEAGEQQGRAAGNADERHEKALFIAEQIAGCHLVGKLHPLPDEADPLQQNALARRRGLGPHKLCGAALQRASQRPQRGRQNGQQDQHGGDQRIGRVAGGDQTGHLIHELISVAEHSGEEEKPDRQTEAAAKQAGGHGVGKIFQGNGAGAVAQGLQRADAAPVLVDHAGHGGGSHQRCHQEEEHREDLGDGLDLFRVALVINIALVALASGQHIPFWILDLCDLVLRVPQLLVCIGDLFFKFLLAAFIVGPAVVQRLSGVCQLGQSVM